MGSPSNWRLKDRTLRLVATMRPATADALLAVPGIGPGKQEMYGGELLRIVADA